MAHRSSKSPLLERRPSCFSLELNAVLSGHRAGRQASVREKAANPIERVSASIADLVSVRALNHPDEWGSSGHCQIEIEPLLQ